MKINSKGQVTIPRAVRELARLYPHSTVNFEVLPNGDVLLRAAPGRIPLARQAFERVRGSANARAFKHMDTNEFMRYLRG